MRIIKYKPTDSLEYKNYLDIGSFYREYYLVDFYINEAQGLYDKWFEYFEQEPIGSKLGIINYHLIRFMGWDSANNSPQIDSFRDVYGDEFCLRINNNLPYLLELNNKWFEEEWWVFKGLDFTLGWHDIESTKENDEGYITEMKFTNGSAISFLDDNDDLDSFFILEELYPELKNDIDYVVTLFQPTNHIKD